MTDFEKMMEPVMSELKKIVFYRRIWKKNTENNNDGKICLSRISNWASREWKLVTLPLKVTYSVQWYRLWNVLGI
jgi:hypothetical protein